MEFGFKYCYIINVKKTNIIKIESNEIRGKLRENMRHDLQISV